MSLPAYRGTNSASEGSLGSGASWIEVGLTTDLDQVQQSLLGGLQAAVDEQRWRPGYGPVSFVWEVCRIWRPEGPTGASRGEGLVFPSPALHRANYAFQNVLRRSGG